MLIERNQNLQHVLNSLKKEVQRATVDRRHPFRWVVLSTYGKMVSSRYVVLRKVEEDSRFLLYTDLRSQKVDHIRKNPEVQLLFFHPQKKAQLIISGVAALHHKDELVKAHVGFVQGEGRKSYTSRKAPGDSIPEPSEAYDWDDSSFNDNFCIISVESNKWEVLQLGGSEHLRAQFRKDDNWKGEWLVP